MEAILVVRVSLSLRSVPAFLIEPYKDVGRTLPLVLWIRPYRDVLVTSAGDVLKTSQGTSLGVTYRTLWGRLQDITLERPQEVIFQRPNDVGRGHLQDGGRRRSLALHRGP